MSATKSLVGVKVWAAVYHNDNGENTGPEVAVAATKDGALKAVEKWLREDLKLSEPYEPGDQGFDILRCLDTDEIEEALEQWHGFSMDKKIEISEQTIKA